MKILPIHPQPLDGEILSSWMVRLAITNGYNLHTFYHRVLGIDDAIWNRDIDAHCSDGLLDILSNYTTISKDKLLRSTLKSYEGILYDSVSQSGNAFVLPLGIRHRTHTRKGMQFCPECLAENIYPSFRLMWRLACVTACHRHKKILMDSCMKCDSPISFHRHVIGGQLTVPKCQIHECFHCQANLIDQTSNLTMDVNKGEVWSLYFHMLGSIESKKLDPSLNWNRSLSSYFKAFRLLASYLFTRAGYPIFQRFNERIGVPPLGRVKGDYEHKPLEARLRINLVVTMIMSEWTCSGENSLGRNELKFMETIMRKVI